MRSCIQYNCCSVARLCPTLCNSMNCSTPDFPVLHYLSEFAQVHVHWDGDTIQLAHLLPSSSPFALNLPSIRVFSNESALHIRWPKDWSFSISPSNEYSRMISFSIAWFDLFSDQRTLKSLLQQHSCESTNPLVLSLLYGPNLTFIHDYWKSHSFDYTDLCQ